MATYADYQRNNRLPVRTTYRDDYDDDDYRNDKPRNNPQRFRNTRTYKLGPDMVTESTYIISGKGKPNDEFRRAMIRQNQDDEVEDIQRDFPPPSPRRIRPRRDPPPPRSYRDDYDDASEVSYRSRRTQRRESSRSPSRSPRRSDVRSRRDDHADEKEQPEEKKKSGMDHILEGLGLGGAAAGVKKLLGKDKEEDRGREAHHDYDHEDDVEGKDGKKDSNARRKWQQAAQAAIITGAIEAWRSKDEPGSWTGAKGIRAATAALSAGGIDGLVDRDPSKHSKRHLLEAVVGGLAANRLVNGKRDKGEGFYDEETGDYIPARTPRSQSIMSRGISRVRSMSRGRRRSSSQDSYYSDEDERRPPPSSGGNKLKELAGAGALAAIGKSVFDRVRSKSRKRRDPSSSRSRSRSRSRSGSPSRSRSAARSRSRNRGRGYSRSSSRSRSPSMSSAEEDDRPRRGGHDPTSRDIRNRSALTNTVASNGGPIGAMGPGMVAAHRGGFDHDMSSSSEDEDDLKAKSKHMRGKELLTAGLATVATIHAANGVYSSMVAHEKRHKMVDAGTMTQAEARKLQTKAWMQDAAAVGIAALGIKGAFTEWKSMSEQRTHIKELEAKKRKKEARHKRREEEYRANLLQMAQAAQAQQWMQQGGQALPPPMMYAGPLSQPQPQPLAQPQPIFAGPV